MHFSCTTSKFNRQTCPHGLFEWRGGPNCVVRTTKSISVLRSASSSILLNRKFRRMFLQQCFMSTYFRSLRQSNKICYATCVLETFCLQFGLTVEPIVDINNSRLFWTELRSVIFGAGYFILFFVGGGGRELIILN